MRKLSILLSITLLTSVLMLGGCGSEPDITGSWRAVLQSDTGDLPFFIDIVSDSSGGLTANIRNREETVPFNVRRTGSNIVIEIEHYDSVIESEIDATGTEMTGSWSKRSRDEKRVTMGFSAKKGVTERFEPITEDRPVYVADITGEWGATFGDNAEPNAIGIFEQSGKMVNGTFMTPTGDYRYLEGTYEKGTLRLSCFDGPHAFLFIAEVAEDGTMSGDFFSSGKKSASWVASKDPVNMPDPYTMTKLTNPDKRMRFSFPDVNGEIVSDTDDRFKGKPMIITVLGTWCPNCNDQTVFMAELYNQYHDKGLEFVSLANEYAGDFEKDKVVVEKFNKFYGIEWPVLIVGYWDKKVAQESLSDLDKVISYPTTIFVGKDGLVKKIYTGFSGPGTGKYYEKLKSDFRATIESMLNE